MILVFYRLVFVTDAALAAGGVAYLVALHHVRRCAACRARHLTH